MIIEKININKIKIVFNITELEEHNISVHSFLSSSFDSQKFIYSILEIAKEEFGFNLENKPLIFETISFNNKTFIIFATKKIITFDHFNTSVTSNNILDEYIIYKFSTYNDLSSFCNYIKTTITLTSVISSLYRFNSIFYLKISFDNLSLKQKNNLICILSEFLNSTKVSFLCSNMLAEHANLLIESNAIEKIL